MLPNAILLVPTVKVRFRDMFWGLKLESCLGLVLVFGLNLGLGLGIGAYLQSINLCFVFAVLLVKLK